MRERKRASESKKERASERENHKREIKHKTTQVKYTHPQNVRIPLYGPCNSYYKFKFIRRKAVARMTTTLRDYVGGFHLI